MGETVTVGVAVPVDVGARVSVGVGVCVLVGVGVGVSDGVGERVSDGTATSALVALTVGPSAVASGVDAPMDVGLAPVPGVTAVARTSGVEPGVVVGSPLVADGLVVA
jgi:hypothetical protein